MKQTFSVRGLLPAGRPRALLSPPSRISPEDLSSTVYARTMSSPAGSSACNGPPPLPPAHQRTVESLLPTQSQVAADNHIGRLRRLKGGDRSRVAGGERRALQMCELTASSRAPQLARVQPTGLHAVGTSRELAAAAAEARLAALRGAATPPSPLGTSGRGAGPRGHAKLAVAAARRERAASAAEARWAAACHHRSSSSTGFIASSEHDKAQG